MENQEQGIKISTQNTFQINCLNVCSSTSWDFTYEHSYFLSHHPRMLGELTGKDVTTIYVSCIEVSVLVERLGIVGC